MEKGFITNKNQMYRLLLDGTFGNHARAWESLDALAASGYRGHVSLRSKETSNPVRLYHVPYDDLATTVAALPPDQTKPGLIFSESPPDAERTLQGEVMRNESGLKLTYSFAPHPMRIAFEKQILSATGLVAGLLLRKHLDPCDYEWIETLLDDWPGHVVEFSGFLVKVGTLQRRCLIWEVRNY